MRLEHNIITTIEGLLEKGHTVELRIEEMPDGERVTAVKRPDSDDVIRINPTLADDTAPTTLSLNLSKGRQDPIAIAVVTVPAAFFISGIKGHQGISK